MRTDGVSPKVVAAAITGLVVYALTKLAIPVDPAVEQIVNVLAMLIAGYVAPAGSVEPIDPGPASDALLGVDVLSKIEGGSDA